ncbi:MAG: pentapeptide repeat-containing protein [Nostoc sp.]|uniref:pentapeptide repeat-containing protein n=1 Tax=Nostoc sp. TaxID=1180 RepID=UPI002FF92A0A
MDEFEEFIRGRALAEEIIKRYETGERNFTGIELKRTVISDTCFMDVDFSRVNLQDCLLQVAYLVNANFTYASLEWTSFSASLINCNLSNANLRGSSLKSTRLIGVDLTSAHLSGADLRETKLIGCNLRNANLTGIRTTEGTIFCDTIMPDGRIETNSPKVVNAQELLKRYADGERDFRDIILHRVDLSGVNLRAVNLCGAYFSHVNLQDTILEGELSAKFICCDMRNSWLICVSPDYGNHPHFCCCDLRWAKGGGGIEPSGAIGCNFQHSNIYPLDTEGDVFVCNTTWFDGEFIIGPVWLMQSRSKPGNINF